jgi:hypothetical protein
MRGGTGPPRLTCADLGERTLRPEAPVHFSGRAGENGTNSGDKCCRGDVDAGSISGGRRLRHRYRATASHSPHTRWH